MSKWKGNNAVRRVVLRPINSDQLLVGNVSGQTELTEARHSRNLSDTVKSIQKESTDLGKGFSLFRSLFPTDFTTSERDLHSKSSYRASNHITVRPKLHPIVSALKSKPISLGVSSDITVKVASPSHRRVYPTKRTLLLPELQEEIHLRHALTYPPVVRKPVFSPQNTLKQVVGRQQPELFSGSLPHILGGAIKDIQ